MKALKGALVVMAGLLLGGASTALAQDSVVAKVPFAFVVNGTPLPAGEYVISRDASHPEVMSIARASGERVTLTLSRAVSTDPITEQDPQLEFRKVAGQYQLTRVILGSYNGREIDVKPSTADATRPVPAGLDHAQR